MARNVLPIRNNVVWAECCTESVYKIDEASNSLAARSGGSNDYFSRRYTRASPINRNIKPTHTYDYNSTGIITVSDQLQKVNTKTRAEDPLLGDAHRLNNDGIYLAKGKIRIYSKRVSASFEDTSAFHQANITGPWAPRIHSPNNSVRPFTLSSHSTCTDRISTSNRHIQLVQIESLHQTFDYNTQVNLSKTEKLDLIWWITNPPSLGGSPILPPTADRTISSDASKIGWGASWGKFRTRG